MRRRKAPKRLVENPGKPPNSACSGNAGDEAVSPESLTRRCPADAPQPLGPPKHTKRVNQQKRSEQSGTYQHRCFRRNCGQLPNKKACDRQKEFRTTRDGVPENSRAAEQRRVSSVLISASLPAQRRPSPQTSRKPQERHLPGEL